MSENNSREKKVLNIDRHVNQRGRIFSLALQHIDPTSTNRKSGTAKHLGLSSSTDSTPSSDENSLSPQEESQGRKSNIFQNRSADSFDSGFYTGLESPSPLRNIHMENQGKSILLPRSVGRGYIPPPRYMTQMDKSRSRQITSGQITSKTPSPTPNKIISTGSDKKDSPHQTCNYDCDNLSFNKTGLVLSPYSDLLQKSNKFTISSGLTPRGGSVYAQLVHNSEVSVIEPPVASYQYSTFEDKVDTSLISAIADADDSDEGSWDMQKKSPIKTKRICKPSEGYDETPKLYSRFSVLRDNEESSPENFKFLSPKRSSEDSSEPPRKIRTPSSSSTSSSSSLRSLDQYLPSSHRGNRDKYKSRSLSEINNSPNRYRCSTPNERQSWPTRSTTDRTPYSPMVSPMDNYRRRSQGGAFLPSYNAHELLTLSVDVGFIDTHCHLDFLFKRADFSGSYSSYRKMMKEYFPKSYEGCVAVFCDPVTFKQKWIWKSLIEEDGVWAAFGCHPHNSNTYNVEIDESLMQALQHPKVRALGEIGLDYSNRNNCDRSVQHKVFRRQLKVAVNLKLPLVIHCREAHEDCFRIMKEIVPDNHRIHLHCFTDTWTVAKMWLDGFVNLCIGITNVVTFPSATSVHEVVKNLPLDRLLLETDTPYFLPRTLPRSLKWSHPGMAIHVAAQVAAIKQGTTIQETMKAVRANTKSVYGI